MVCGGSKRGWTTWTTAAVDKRVVAIVPFVIDMLNVEPSFVHHWEAYGFWAPAVGDYVAMKIMDWNDSPEYKAVEDRGAVRISRPADDAQVHRQRHGRPVLSARLVAVLFQRAAGPKFLRYVPNGDHSLDGTDAPFSLLAYYTAVLNAEAARVHLDGGPDESNDREATKDKPKAVKLWQATNPEARDFRVDTIGKVWKSEQLSEPVRRHVRRQGGEAGKGLHGLPGRADVPQAAGPPLKFTTQVKVVPDVMPFKYKSPTPPR